MEKINLNELTLENFAEWPMPVKYGMMVVLSLAVIALGYWFLIKPGIEQSEALKRKETTLKQEFEQKQQQAANLQAYKDQLKSLQDKFGEMLSKLPAEHEMPGLLEDISKTGIASGLTFELFAPQPEFAHDFYIEMPIKISVVGNYHQLAVFLSRIAQMGRIVTLHDFDIVRPKASKRSKSKKPPSDRLEMNLIAKIYRYRSS